MDVNKQLAIDISNKLEYQPMDDRILVKPLKPVMITKLLPTAPAVTAKSLDDVDKQEPTEPTKQKVEAIMRKGIILKLGKAYETINPDDLQVGDIVVYPVNSGIPFDLFKDSRLLRRYEVLSKVIQ
jgi:hypothetical protein